MDDDTLQLKVRKAYLAQHDTKHQQKIRSHAARFVKLRSEAGYNPELPTAKAVTHYLSNFHEKNGSAKSLRQVASYPEVCLQRRKSHVAERHGLCSPRSRRHGA